MQREWTLKRNCSISPRQLGLFYLSLCGVSLLMALIFALHGAWVVLIFSVLELSVVGAAFLYYARHASDREHLVLQSGSLLVEVIESDSCRRFCFDVDALQVDVPGRHGSLIGLRVENSRIEVGRFLSQFRRREVALELRQALGAGH